MDWHTVVDHHFPHQRRAVEACLSVACALLLEDSVVCPALALVGPPSSLKTTVVEMLDVANLTHHLDSFSPRSFVSHFAAADSATLKADVDLLYKVRHRLVIVPDISPFFSRRAEELAESVGILTRILDGHGYVSHSGVHGQRGEHGDFRFGFLAATTPMGGQVWKLMSTLGPRLLMLQMDPTEASMEQQVEAMRSVVTFQQQAAECRAATSGWLSHVWEVAGGSVGCLSWSRGGDDPKLQLRLVQLARLGVALRGQPSKDRLISGQDYEYLSELQEGPARYRQSLYNLARGHAISELRSTIDTSDVAVAADVVLSTGPTERLRLVRHLAKGGKISSDNEAAIIIGRAWNTAHLVLQQLGELGLLEHGEVAGGWQLSEEYKWLTEVGSGQ